MVEKDGELIGCINKELILWTASPLTDAIHHYERLGFCCVEKVENSTWSMDGEKLEEVKMVMQFR